MLKNKLIFELYLRLCIGKGHRRSKKIIYQIFKIIQQTNINISPVYIIETAIFNMLIPIRETADINIKNILMGNSLKQTIIKALLLVIRYAKDLRNNQSIAQKLSLIFLQLYKKDHNLYKQKKLHINKILNS